MPAFDCQRLTFSVVSLLSLDCEISAALMYALNSLYSILVVGVLNLTFAMLGELREVKPSLKLRICPWSYVKRA